MKNLLYVYKCMGIILQNEWRSRSIFAAIIIVLISLLVSRALLSVSLFVFVVLTTLHSGIFSQLQRFLRSPLLLGMSILFFIPFISGLWSDNLPAWGIMLRIKIPFLLLPLAFAGNWQLSEKQWRIIAYSFLVSVAVACCVSLWQYFLDMEVINRSYLKAKTLPTPLEDDHVRFSWLVSIAIVTAAFLIYTSKNKAARFAMIFLSLLLIIYLHILSARTGLISLYFFRIAENIF